MTEIYRKKKIIIYLLTLGILAIGSTTFAVNWPPSPGFDTILNPADPKCGLSTLIKYFYEWAVSLGGLAVFIVLVIAGIQFLTSAGNPAQMTEAKGRMQSAALGLILLLGSVLILNTINPELTTFRPLVLPEPSELLGNCEKGGICKDKDGKEYKCSGNEYCKYNFGDDYECKDNVCTINLTELFKVVDCKSVSIKKVGGKPVPLNIGDRTKKIELDPEEPFELKANPPEGRNQCMANLILYEGSGWWGGCSGNKRTLAIQPGVGTKDNDPYYIFKNFALLEGTDILVKCIELEKI